MRDREKHREGERDRQTDRERERKNIRAQITWCGVFPGSVVSSVLLLCFALVHKLTSAMNSHQACIAVI